jgi:hypothetical protein
MYLSSGDAVEVKDYVTQEQALIPLAGPANRQGRIAADNIAGRSSSFRGSQGTSVLGLFGMTLAGTGASEKTLKRIGRPYSKVGKGSRRQHKQIRTQPHDGHQAGSLGKPMKLPNRLQVIIHPAGYVVRLRQPVISHWYVLLESCFLQVYIHSNNHAGYYPGAKTIDLKLLFDPKVRSSLATVDCNRVIETQECNDGGTAATGGPNYCFGPVVKVSTAHRACTSSRCTLLVSVTVCYCFQTCSSI